MFHFGGACYGQELCSLCHVGGIILGSLLGGSTVRNSPHSKNNLISEDAASIDPLETTLVPCVSYSLRCCSMPEYSAN